MATTGTSSNMRYTPGALGAGDGGYGLGHKGGGSMQPTPNESDAEAARLNRYSHNADTIPTVPAPEVKLAFEPNLLDNYDAVTYHFKLFMVSLADSSTGNVLDPQAQVIIAESGVSDLTIDKVEFDAIAVPSIEAGTGTQISVKFEIVEPSGAGLLDKMYYESIDLGIGNWAVMPLYLQAEFRGRDPKTSNSDADGSPGSLGNLRWLWTLKMNNIQASVTEVGTRYTFSAILYNEHAQSNSVSSIQHNISLTNIDTFQDAMNELADKINKDQLLKLIDNYSKPDVYKFVIDPKIAGFHINKENSNADPSRNGEFDKFDGKSANFSTGTSLDKIVDTLLSHTVEYQKLIAGAPAPGAEGAPAADEPSQMKLVWRMITESRPIVFDKRRNDNAIEFTYFIVAYDIGILDVNVFQTTNITPEMARKRTSNYAEKALLKKKYNYIFTGLNDQIKSFDLTLNNSYATALTRYGGVYLNAGAADKGVVQHDNSEEEKQATDSLRKLISLQNDATTTAKQLISATDDYKSKVAAAKLPADTVANYEMLISAARPENKLNLGIYSENYNVTSGTSINKASFNARQLAKPINDNVPAFVSDVNVQSSNTLTMYNQYLAGKSPGGDMRPVAFREANQNSAVGAGAESASNSGLTKLASIFSSALHSTVDVNLVSIKLTIKGDPFWLFPQPIQDNNSVIFNTLKSPADAIDFIKRGQHILPNAVNIHGADNFILIRFRTPRIFNTSTNDGDVDPFTEVEMFSGIYKVLTIKSRFEMGAFVQDLECQLDNVIKLSDISALIELDAGNQDIPATVDNFYPSTDYTASNAPDQTAAETARLNAGIITPADADLERLKRTTYNTTADAQQARLAKAIKG